MLRIACVLVLASSALVACGPDRPQDPDLATIRSATWTNSAKELSGGRAGARVYGFGDVGMGGPNSVAAGNLVLSGASTDRIVTIAAQSARSGEIVWRRDLPIGSSGYVDCAAAAAGPVFPCLVGKPRSATLWLIAERTGAVRKKITVEPGSAFGVEGDDLYLATFKPAKKDTVLNVTVQRRSWSSGKTTWRQKTSFAIEGWGHDGGQGFDIGRSRVVASSASWQVVVDKNTGRLLDRADEGRWESSLKGGGRVVVDSGDGSADVVHVTLFSPDGRPIHEATEALYPLPLEIDAERLAVGRRIVSVTDGKTLFTAPRRTHIVAVADDGRRAVVEPDEFEFSANKVPLSIYDTSTGTKVASLTLKGNIAGETIAGGRGVVKVIDHYDDKTDTSLPPTIEVIDVSRPAVVARMTVKRSRDDFGSPSLVKTTAGFAVTDGRAVRGFVASD